MRYNKIFNNFKKLINNNLIKKTMKLKTIIDSMDGLTNLASVKLPAILSYKLALLLKHIDVEVAIYNKVRIEKAKEIGTAEEKDGKPTGNYKFETPEKVAEFTKVLEELGDQEIELKVPNIKIDDLKTEAGKELVVEPKYLAQLEWLIKE